MEIHLRKLVRSDLEDLNSMAQAKISAEKEGYADFSGFGNDTIFHLYVLPEEVRGSEITTSYGCFIDGQLVAAAGVRINGSTWIFSFLVTRPECIKSMIVIKKLVDFVVETQEKRGFHHWYVVSANKRFKVWQRLFTPLRKKYHHYTYAVIPANSPPKRTKLLEITGGKIFPYNVTISMYVSKSMCTSL